MSDLWIYSPTSPPPNIHQSSAVISSSPPPLSLSTFKNHGNHAHTKITSNHHSSPELQEASLQLPNAQATFPHLHLPQISSPHLSYSQVPSLHLHPPQVISPHFVPQPHVTSPYLHHSQVTSLHLPCSQVTSPHWHPTHVTSPQCVPQPQVTSPHFHYSQVTSPHLSPPQVTSSHPQNSQGTSPQLSHHQVNSPHLASPEFINPQLFPSVPSKFPLLPQSQTALSYNLTHPRGTSPHHPHPHVTSPNFELQPQLTSSNLVTQCQIMSPDFLSPPQNSLPSQNHNPGLDNLNWSSRSELSPELSCFPNSYSYSYQTTAHLEFSLQNQNGFSDGVTHQRDTELENKNRLPYNTHTLIDSGLYANVDTCGPVQDTWQPLEPTLSELQCSPLGTISGGETTARWNPVEFNSPSTEDFSNTQFFPDSYHDNNAPQPFCSPSTPGPSPHYPQTQSITSPGPQMHPSKEKLFFPTQTPSHLKTAKTISYSLHESNSYPLTSDPSQHEPHESSNCPISIKPEPIQDQRCFSTQGRGQDGSSAAQSPGLSAGLNWKVECGEQRRRAGGGNGQADWSWIKSSQHENSTDAPAYRLQCTVCKRDFKSLPALNGHMRSHSGIRAATCLKKGEDSCPPVLPSIPMVMPASVPVQSRGVSKASRGGRRRCSQLTLTSKGTVLFHSLMHLKEEDEVTRGNKDNGKNGEGVSGGGRSHYTPPPMLCPQRAGPGLYCSLTNKQQTVQLLNMHNKVKEHVDMETLTTGIYKSHINVGWGFQAQIPALRDQKYVHSDSHNALLLWTPWDKLECPVNEERVEEFLSMARSSVMPGGGVSPEYALHVLSESRGDFLLTIEKLLSTPDASSNHTGWSATERRLLIKSLQQHHKDFSSIQRDVKTKSLSQCVEFYYLWKKKLSLTVKLPARLTITLPNRNGQTSSSCNETS